MTKEQILSIIEDEASYFGLSKEDALSYLQQLGLTIEKIMDHSLMDESKIRNSVAMGYHAFRE